jgi:hypothetical protein
MSSIDASAHLEVVLVRRPASWTVLGDNQTPQIVRLGAVG